MKKNSRLFTTIAAGSLICAGIRYAAAQVPAVDFDQAAVAAPAVGEGLGAGFKAFGRRAATEQQERLSGPVGIPQRPQNAFAGVDACGILDAKFLAALSIQSALDMLQPCVEGLSKKYALRISAKKGIVPTQTGRGEAIGIHLTIEGIPYTGNHCRMDLNYSLQQRQGRLLGFTTVIVDAPGALSALSVAEPSAIPAWLDRASLRIDTKLTKVPTVEGGLHLILFDKDDNMVQFDVPSAQIKGGQTTVNFVKADDQETGPFSIQELKGLGSGEMASLVESVGIPAELGPRAQAAVKNLFDGLRR